MNVSSYCKIIISILLIIKIQVLSQSNNGSSSDNGINVNFDLRCYNLKDLINNPTINQYLDTLCLGITLDTCAEKLFVNATYGSSTLFYISQSNISQAREQCGNPVGPCRTCLVFNDIKVSPAYAKVCYQLIERCPFPIPNVDISSNCISLGTDCSTRNNCTSCNAAGSCGWCAGDSTCRAINPVNSRPYCSSCSASWMPSTGDCPSTQLQSTSSSSGLSTSSKIAIGVIVPVVIIAIGLIVIACIIRRKKRNAIHGQENLSFTEIDTHSTTSEERPTPLADADELGYN